MERPMRHRHMLSSALLVALAALAPARAADPPSHDEARDFLRSLFVASPYRLNANALSGEIRYRLTTTAPQPWQPPRTGEQAVAVDGGGLQVSICTDCGDEPAPSADTLKHHLAANAWVRSDDPRIRSFARLHGRGRSVQARMERLTDAVRAHMNGPIDYRHYHDAATALQNRSGDCTEFAVLLAAVARARGIPTRIVHGIAYSGRLAGSSHVFSPHAWVQAWDGTRWTSYDAGFGQFGAGHIVLAIGDGDPASLRGLNRATRQLRIVDAAQIQRERETASN
jgi:transglutaminase-like putative cysteine protease